MVRNAGKPKGKNKKDDSPAIKREAVYWGMGLAGILLLVAVLIPERVGLVGRLFHSLLVGLFGLGGLVLPIGLICFAVLGLTAREVFVPWVRAVLMGWLVLALLHTIVAPVGVEYTGMAYLSAVYSSGRMMSGGVVGAILSSLFRLALGRILSGLVMVVLIIVLFMFITGRSIASLIGHGVGKAKDMYEERNATHQDYDDEDDDFIPEDDKDLVPKLVPKKPVPKPEPKAKPRKAKRPKALKPLAEREGDEVWDRSAELIHFPEDEDHLGEHGYTVRLIQEELEDIEPPDHKPREVPAYLLPPGKRPRPGQPSRMAAEPREIKITPAPIVHGGTTAVPEPRVIPVAPSVGYAPPPAGETTATYEPTEDFEADFEDDFHTDFEADYEEDFEADEDAPHWPQPETDHTPLVVRGLIDDPPEAPPQDSYTGYEPEDDPFLDADEMPFEDATPYNEYDHMTQLANPPTTPMPQPAQTEAELYANFQLPTIDFLAQNTKPTTGAETRMKVMENSNILEETLRSFRIEAKVVEVSVGPTVTRYDLSPGPGVKVSSIANLSNDLALSLAAQGIRIEAPIPGKAAVGIEIPNKDPQGVFLREIIEGERFENFSSKLAFAVGKDIAGNPVVADVADMPHLLIAGATGAGKSVCINTLIASLLYKAKPNEVKLLMIDPKVVELSVYNGIPHLLIPVVTDPKKASGALNWAVQEMESRYNAFAETGCRDLKGYNRHIAEEGKDELPQIVIIIDELADLMMTCKGEVEEAICRLAQKARAAGIHLIVATQRPSVDVITGLIKANIPSRLAFAVSSGTDSRTVLDMQGAEKLLGRGDMLFLPRGQNKPIRVQGGFISDKEVEQLVAFLKAQAPVEHTTEMIQQITMPGKANIEGELDEFFHDAVEFLLVKGKASTSMLQRQFRIGYNRASRLMDDLEMRGIVGPEDGVKPRKVTITREEYREIYGM